jgi:hypothetical protein
MKNFQGSCLSFPQPTASSPQDEDPIWVKREKQREFEAKSGKKGLPWPVYLLSSAIVAIASVSASYIKRTTVAAYV